MNDSDPSSKIDQHSRKNQTRYSFSCAHTGFDFDCVVMVKLQHAFRAQAYDQMKAQMQQRATSVEDYFKNVELQITDFAVNPAVHSSVAEI